MNSRTNTLEIRTPEGVAFSFQLAGPMTRFLAWTVDVLLVFSVMGIASVILTLATRFSLDFSMTFLILVYFAVPVLYGMLFEWFLRGQTPGKRMLRLRVIDEQGLRLQFSQVVVRNLLRFVDALPFNLYLVGGMSCLLSRKAQRLGDLAASTVVIRTSRLAEPDLDQVLAGKYNSLRDYPYLEARLRQRVSPREAGIALQAIVRREQLKPEARVQLFEDLAAHFKSLVEFPQEATDGITDEQYVRNVVDVVFRPKSGGTSREASRPST